MLDALEASGQAERTIIVYTADHGDMVAGHGMRQKGAIPFKEGWNVPFVVVHPDHGGRGIADAVATSVDIAPTLLRWAGVSSEAQAVRDPQPRGFDVAGVVGDGEPFTERGSTTQPGTGALNTYDVLWAVDMEFIAEVASGMIDLGDDEEADQEQQGKLDKAKDLVGSIRNSHFDARHVMRGVYDGRHKLIRYHGIDNHNQPATIEDLYRDNDVAPYDLWEDPDEIDNLANQNNPTYDEALVASMNDKFNTLVRTELGVDPDIVERPLLFMGVAGFKQRIKSYLHAPNRLHARRGSRSPTSTDHGPGRAFNELSQLAHIGTYALPDPGAAKEEDLGPPGPRVVRWRTQYSIRARGRRSLSGRSWRSSPLVGSSLFFATCGAWCSRSHRDTGPAPDRRSDVDRRWFPRRAV